MAWERVFLPLRSLRSRLMLWNAGAVALTGVITLLAVREGVRYALIADLDQVLREDVKEIGLAFDDQQNYDWDSLTEEMNRKAQGHDFHQWFVQFYDRGGQPVWSSVHTPQLPPLSDVERRLKKFSWGEMRLSYAAVPRESDGVAAVCVGCSQRFVARDMGSIDRLVMGVGLIVLLLSPVAGHLLTNRTIQPLAQMIRTTARLRPGELGQRMPIRGTGDELDSLARTINGLLDRITSYLQQEHDFLANAAHDLRTPLAAIRSSVEVALSGRRTEAEYHELLGVVIEQCSALQTLVNQLLLLAETDADRLQTDPEPVPLDEVVTRACEMFGAVAEFHGLELRVAPLPPAAVAGNRHHLRQVVNNLLDNAIKFTAQGGAGAPASGVREHADGNGGPQTVEPNREANTSRSPTIDASHSPTIDASRSPTIEVELVRDESRQQVRLRIADTGAGIAAEHLPHIFERFYRADPARGRDGVHRGTGLGLSICKAIVEAHGGTISVKSKAGQGTAISIILPLAPQDVDGAASRRQRAVAADA